MVCKEDNAGSSDMLSVTFLPLPPLTVSDAIVLHTIYSHPNDIYSPDFPFFKSGNI